MKRITIKSMRLTNFKGVRSLDVTFGSETSIFGRNGTGKTTIMDAFTWVLFDKDSKDSKGFQVATTDKDGAFIPHMTHEAEIVLDIDGREMTLTKKYSDNWVKQKGSTEERFDGWKTTYLIDSVPMRKTDYTARVAEICSYDTFKLITIPGYIMTWDTKKRRNFLLELAGGDLTNEEIANGDKELMTLIMRLEGRTFEDYNTMISAQLKRLREERDKLKPMIEQRTSDIRTDLPTMEEVQSEIADKKEASRQISVAIAKKQQIPKDVEDRNRKRIEAIARKEAELLRKVNDIRFKNEAELSELKSKLSRKDLEIKRKNERLKELKRMSDNILAKLEECNRKREELLGEFSKVKAAKIEIDKTNLVCPVCKRALDGEMFQEKYDSLVKEANLEKVARLTDINTRGASNKAAIEQCQEDNSKYLGEMNTIRTELKGLAEEHDRLMLQISEFKSLPDDMEQIIKEYSDLHTLREEIDKLKEQKDEDIPEVDVTELLEGQETIMESIGQLNQTIADIRTNEANMRDLEEKTERFKEINETIAGLEKQEDAIMRFSHKRVDMLQAKINAMFDMVTFRLFKDQINGGEADIAEAYFNGVPYSTNLNTGARINAGVDMCNGISRIYGIEAPQFIDNAEAVNELIPSDSQIVKLIVSEDDKLRITTK